MNRYSVGESERRPWGSWKVIHIDHGVVVKSINVLPERRLSLQYHLHRSETWVVTAGIGVAQIGSRQVRLEPGVTVDVPARATHRLTNVGESPLKIIEIQKGTVLDEDDIVRVSDDYDRCPA